MIIKKDMHRVIELLLLLLSQYTILIYSESDTNNNGNGAENAVKRYNLQDLIGQEGVTLDTGIGGAPAVPKTQTIDVSELLKAAQNAAAKQESRARDESLISSFVQPKKPMDIELSSNKDGDINLADLPGFSRNKVSTSNMNMNDLSSLFKPKHQSEETANNMQYVKQEFNLGKQKLEIEAAGKRTTRYTLAKGPDGGLNLVPIIENDPERKYEVMQPKGYEEKAGSRQQMQLTTLSQALYSPFPSEQNILHLHLKGKDGKDGKAGPKGPMGVYGPKGPEGPKGPKGDAGTCSAQINGLFECTPDELDSLSNRVDYLEKICKKVENAAKKHVLHSDSDSSSKYSSKTATEESSKKESSFSGSDVSKKTGTATKEVKEEPKKDDSATDKDILEKEKEKAKQEAKEAIEKEVREEVARRLKEQVYLKLEKEAQENAKTRSTPDDTRTAEKEKIAVENEKEKENADAKKKEDIAPKPIHETESDIIRVEKTEEKPAKKSKDASPPSLRSMIDIKAKLKIAELDLMDRVNQAKTGVTTA